MDQVARSGNAGRRDAGAGSVHLRHAAELRGHAVSVGGSRRRSGVCRRHGDAVPAGRRNGRGSERVPAPDGGARGLPTAGTPARGGAGLGLLVRHGRQLQTPVP
ncbi:hypothetical protein ON010_g4968 [Phytophthora cinnamomi]|nr:hypothetical protein ON010_g4968 [Phytophthora cinnamomi]